MWHAQTTSLTLRHYPSGASYEGKDPFDAVAQVEFLGDGEAFIHGALRIDGRALTMSQWRQLALMLRAQHGVLTLHAERRGRRVSFDLARA